MQPGEVIGKVVRYGMVAVAAIAGLTLMIWVVLLIYVNQNEKKLIDKVSSVIGQRTKGEVTIGGLSVSFIRTFPLLSLQLSDVVINDSLFTEPERQLLKASDIYLRASIGGLLWNKLPVDKVIIRDGRINLLTDSSGNTNEYVLKSGNDQNKDNTFSMPDIVLQSVVFNYENPLRFKHYHALIRTFKCFPKNKGKQIVFDTKLQMLVRNLSFNTAKGAYLKEKIVSGNFNLLYDPEASHLIVDHIKINLDRHPFYFNGKFRIDKNSPDFNLSISAGNISFSSAISLLTDTLHKKLNEFALTKPLSFGIELSGQTKFRYIPRVEVSMEVKDNKILTPKGVFEDCTFKAFFTNEKIIGEDRVDGNSMIKVSNFSGRWENLVIQSKNITVSNLKRPFLECDISSDVDMESLNSLAGSSTIQFLKGKVSLNILFKGHILGEDSTASDIDGQINIYNASIKYLPRNFLLSGCNGSVKFIKNDLVVNKIIANAGSTQLNMSGSAKNFLSMLKVSPEKLVLKWKISSPEINLEDFKGFITKAETKIGEGKGAKFKSTASKVDKMFAEGDMYINLVSPSMKYKTFHATDVRASVILKPAEIAIENIQLNHANGSMDISGSLKNGVKFNPVRLRTNMRNMDVPLLFEAFSNFGQDAITHKNLKGKLSARVDFSTAINNNAELIAGASEGSVRFLLKDGELNNFEPLMEISKKAFKKQDFTQIRFADLENELNIKGTAFIVNPMDIRSTALNISVEGIYDVKKGTDMSIRLPFTNLTKSQANTNINDDGKTKKGAGLRLRAKTDDSGKLKITWDPFRRSIKNKEQIKDSTKAEN